MYCSFGPEWAPVATAPGFDLLSSGVGRLLDGTEVVRLMNEIKPTSDGFELKLGFFVRSQVPPGMTEAHVEQQMVEWVRWIEMARAHVSDSAGGTVQSAHESHESRTSARQTTDSGRGSHV